VAASTPTHFGLSGRIIVRGTAQVLLGSCDAKNLPTKTVHMLHRSMVEIVQMRRSIERVQLQIDRSRHASRQSAALLRPLTSLKVEIWSLEEERCFKR